MRVLRFGAPTESRPLCLDDTKNFRMGHVPQTMSELYSHICEELEMRFSESEWVGYDFDLYQ